MIRYVDGSTQLYDLRSDYWQLHDLGPDHEQHEPMLQALIECSRESGLEIA
ncbi:MAG: hypothetical protein R3E47_02470 [Paracoccaceae bacterium]